MITNFQLFESLKNNLEPIEVYHGSDSIIDKFNIDYVGGKNAKDAIGPGIYLTSNKEEESALYGKYIYTLKLNIVGKLLTDKVKKYFTMEEAVKLIKMREGWEYNAQDWDENADIGLKKFLREIYSTEDSDKDIILSIWGDFYRYSSKEYVKNAWSMGIDGLKVTNYWGGSSKSSTNYIIYNPDIIQIIKKEENK